MVRMSRRVRMTSVVLFVSDLGRSVVFYRELFDLAVASESDTAVLLTSDTGFHLFLRAMGADAAHPLGGVGLQYVIWTSDDDADLRTCERVLRDGNRHRRTDVVDGVTIVEGRDPDNVPVLITHPGLDQVSPPAIPRRVYEW